MRVFSPSAVFLVSAALSLWVQTASADSVQYLGSARSDNYQSEGLRFEPMSLTLRLKSGGFLLEKYGTASAAGLDAARCGNHLGRSDIVAAPGPVFIGMDAETSCSDFIKAAYDERLTARDFWSLVSTGRSAALQSAIRAILKDKQATYRLRRASFSDSNATGMAVRTTTDSAGPNTAGSEPVMMMRTVLGQGASDSTGNPEAVTVSSAAPGIYTMLFLGLGLMGFVALRRDGDYA